MIQVKLYKDSISYNDNDSYNKDSFCQQTEINKLNIENRRTCEVCKRNINKHFEYIARNKQKNEKYTFCCPY